MKARVVFRMRLRSEQAEGVCQTWPYPDALQADLVAHRVSQTLGALLRHPLGHGNSGDAARLSADDVGHLLSRTVQRGVQDELRDLGGLPTPAAKQGQIQTQPFDEAGFLVKSRAV